MLSTVKWSLILSLLLVALAGCEDVLGPRPEKQEVSEDAPPEPTAQDIANKIIADAQLDMPVPGRGATFPPPVKNNMLNALRTARATHNADPKGKEALEFVVQRIDKRVRDFKGAESWEHLLGFIEAYEIFNPESKKYNLLREQTMTELRKPRVNLIGLPTLEGQKIAVLEFYVPIESRRYKERLYIGDESHGVRVVEVFGADLGVMLEFLETGERFVAYLPSNL